MHPDPMYLQDMDMFGQDMKTILSAGPDMIEFCICPYHVPHEATYPDTQDYDQVDWLISAMRERQRVVFISGHICRKFSMSYRRSAGQTFRRPLGRSWDEEAQRALKGETGARGPGARLIGGT